MTGSAKQSSLRLWLWIASSQVLLAMTEIYALRNKGSVPRSISISASSRAASVEPTSTIGNRTSALSIRPMRQPVFCGRWTRLGEQQTCQVADRVPARLRRLAIALPQQRAHRGKAFSLDMGRQQDGAVGTVGQRIEILRIVAVQHPETRGTPGQQVDRLRAVGATILQADNVGMARQVQQGIVRDVDAGAVGDVVEHDRP